MKHLKWTERYTAGVVRAGKALASAQDDALAEGLSRLEKVCRRDGVVVRGGHVEAPDGGDGASEEADVIIDWLMGLDIHEDDINALVTLEEAEGA